MSDTLSGKTIVITGASSGIGRAAAIDLAGRGADVAVVGRNPERTRAVAAQVGGRAFIADYDRLDDVRRLADELLEEYPKITVLANNAGGLISRRGLSADGHERIFQHNHLAPFLLTGLLLPRLTESGGRVISTASAAAMFGAVHLDDLDSAKGLWLGGWRAYGTSKLETILFIRELARRTAATGVDAYSFHPGLVSTSFGDASASLKVGRLLSGGTLGLTAEQGAAPLIHLAATTDLGVASGIYFDGLKPNGMTRRAAKDDTLAAALWARSEELTSA
ncbi:MAG: short-chain dehydrogenase [Microbacteriaceae bacterium]|nr:short-chain dehydrogenase [Microbacteriaceae bacterium]